jgi:gluconate 5-dehydrogenase
MSRSVHDLFDLTGRVALVSGGSRGLGLQMAEALGELGARIAITARKQVELDAAAASLGAAGHEVLTVRGDLSDFASVPGLVDAVLARFGQVDILVNNAGASWGAPAEDYPLEAWHKVINLNLSAAFVLTQEIGRRSMLPRGAGRIINIASIAGLLGNPPDAMKTIAYNTSKGGLVNFTRALAAEWGPRGITVNAICPGFFPSKMSEVLIERIGKQMIAATPIHRLGNDEDLKGLIALLASDASRHITGQVIAVDGGITAV